MGNQPTADQWIAIDAALAESRTIDAIRLYREATGVGLFPARQALEARARETARPAGPPEPVTRYLNSGFARPGELWTWWTADNGDWCVLVRLSEAGSPRFELGVFPPNVGSWGQQLNGATLSLTELTTAVSGSGLLPTGTAIPTAIREALRGRLSGLVVAAPTRSPRKGYVSASRTALHRLDDAAFQAWLHLPEPLPWGQWEQLLTRARALPAADDQLEGLDLPGAADSVTLPPMLAPVLFVLCATDCSEDAFVIERTDHYFGDLEAIELLAGASPNTAVAWHLFRRCVDVAGNDRPRLPRWLQAFCRTRASSVGLLTPAEARSVASARGELEVLLSGKADVGDTRALLDLIAAAAAHGQWVLGFEPGS